MANSVDQTAENGKYCRPWSDCSWIWQWTLTLLRLMQMANSVDSDQTAENDSVDLDQTAENDK